MTREVLGILVLGLAVMGAVATFFLGPGLAAWALTGDAALIGRVAGIMAVAFVGLLAAFFVGLIAREVLEEIRE